MKITKGFSAQALSSTTGSGNLTSLEFCNKGTTSVGPNQPRQSEGLYSLRKNSEFGPVLKGHEFTRADNARRINAALAAEGRLASLHREQMAFFSNLFSP
jgi:hypothetical protein